MAIELLGRIVMEKDGVIKKQEETIDELHKKLKIFEDYLNFYENLNGKGEI